MDRLKLSILLGIAFLAVLGAGGLLIAVYMPRASLEAPPPGQPAAAVADSPSKETDRAAPSKGERPVATEDDTNKRKTGEAHPAEATAADAGITEDPKGDLPASTEDVLHHADPAQEPKTVENNEDVTEHRAPQPRAPGHRRSPIERWWVHSVSVLPQVFLIDGVDDSGVRRVALPAPVDQRFVLVSISLTWEGQRKRTIYFESSRIGPPTIQLATNGGAYDPIGRLISALDPLAPLNTDRLIVAEDERVDLEVAFLLPNHVGPVSLVLDGQSGDTFELPPSGGADLPELLGVWHKADTQLHALRYDDPLIDALADPGCRLLWITADKSGLPRLNFPSASVTSNELPAHDDGTVARVELSRGKHRQPGWLRAIDGGSTLLLYVGERSRATFMFERSRRQP